MTNVLALPNPSAPREHIADWLELRTLQAARQATSFREVIRDYKIGGVTDSTEEWAEGDDAELDEDDACEALAEAAFAEIAERELACGGPGAGYPFDVQRDMVSGKPTTSDYVYTFLALLSRFGKDAGPRGKGNDRDKNGEKIFEDVCAKAAEAYLGSSPVGPTESAPIPRAHSYVFGFPRVNYPGGFKPALDNLCQELGEGLGCHPERTKAPDQKDGKLDIVAWKEFADSRPGKLIAFGQCATGEDWDEKLTDLPPALHDWWTKWIRDRPHVWPIRMFFVPHRIVFDDWFYACVDGGILFDRCRIAQLTVNIDPDIAQRCAQWSAYVINERLNT